MKRGDIPFDVTHLRIHSSVRMIHKGAFKGREHLRIVIYNDRLEEIGEEAFMLCTSVREIIIPNAVRTIKDGAFCNCMGLTSVTLGDGLEEIGAGDFIPAQR
jgi:hypothetical protein